MPPPHLDPSRAFVTQLFAALSTHAGDEPNDAPRDGANALKCAGNEMKKQLLALHVTFPNELLPALDLLDRKLVTRFHISRKRQHGTQCAAPHLAREGNREANVDMTPGRSVPGVSGDDCSVKNPSAMTGIGPIAVSEADVSKGDALHSEKVENAGDHANVIL